MNSDKKMTLIRFLISFGVASLITFIVIAIEGFFTDELQVNLGILTDAFCVSGALLLMFAAMLFISGEGALLGIGFILRNVVLAFVPMGRLKHEKYADYRARKLSAAKERRISSVLVIGLVFLAVGIIFMVIWLQGYTPPADV